MSSYKVIAYTDGGVSGNQNTENYGGWGAVVLGVESFGEKEITRKELFGSAVNTTNNIMELTGAINALQAIKKKDIPVEVYVDSNYVLKGITEWIHGWKARGWRKADKKPVENIQLWMALEDEVSKFKSINFFKVKAHVGVELNELADQLANKGILQAKGA